MSMYRSQPPLGSSHDLEQGDILAKVLVAIPPSGKSLAIVRNRNKMQWPVPSDVLRNPTEELRAMCKVSVWDLAIVVSNSCDNAGDYPVLIAPIRPFRFSSTDPTDAERWLEVSEAATGTASPKLFYLPADEGFGLERSEARLPDLLGVEHSFLQRVIAEGEATRVCGLDADAQRHLQWSLGLLFSRDPRDDGSWPSAADLRLKLAWLEEEMPRSRSRREGMVTERDRIRGLLGMK